VIDRYLSGHRSEVSKNPPRVSIGLPTYNRPELLALVLECFRHQTFEDFELIVSDNASPNPEVRRLCERCVEQDSRFRYVRQPVNQGAEKNFWYVYDQASAPLFMWAADDDLWPLDFLEKAVVALEANPRASAWFCQVVNVNTHGMVVRSYPSFQRFQSGAWKSIDLARFLWEPEIMGKANLVYSIYRRQTLSETIEKFRALPASWGGDMNLVYGYLCRNDLIIDDQVVLQKRVSTKSIQPVLNPRSQIYPREMRTLYFRNYRKIARGTGHWLLTTAVLLVRSLYDYWFSGRALEDYEFWIGRFFRVLARLRARFNRT
jgi:glycosyltransferase involved in cell wall biosynthesis